jgi:putative serine protease PepD
MATETEMTSAREPGPGQNQAQVPVLVTRLGGQQRIFPVGTQVRVGRDPTLELVSVNPLVSRQTHGVITSDQGGATYVDQSRRGTFLDGRQLSGPLRITESVVLRLGDPATGEELGITPPLTSTQLAHNHGRRILGGRLRRGALAGVAVAAVAALATYGFFALRPAGNGLGGGQRAAVLRHAEAATVRLLMGSPEDAAGWGSGTVISPTGLILTNSHVAQPRAPGLAVSLGQPLTDSTPSYLTVEMTTGPSSSVVARYRARTVAVDGYLDLAVVQIYATLSGKPVSPGSLHLPYLTLGNEAALQLDQNVTTLGFPGMSGSDSITVTSGVLDTFVPDPLKHVKDPRFELETTAKIGHGNSGGAAINDAGQLIGVPSLGISGEGSDVSWRLRSVAEARPLIAAARNHTAYHSKILVQMTGHESVSQVGVSTDQQGCPSSQTTTASASATFGFGYSGFPQGLDVALYIGFPDGGHWEVDTDGTLPQTTSDKGGCLSYTVTAAGMGQATMPTGTYQLQLFAGPSLTPVGTPAVVHITAPATPPAGSGSSSGAGN